VAFGALLLAIVVPSALADTEIKKFRADFIFYADNTDTIEDSIPAGSTATITLTITNDSASQQFGSSDVTAPAGHTITQVVSVPAGSSATIASSTELELRNLGIPPGQHATISFSVKTPCQALDYTWELDGKQANNHSGDAGNNFQLEPASDLTTTVDGKCRLAFGFTRQPADAEKSPTIITSVPRDPSGAPVQVEVRSADVPGEGVPLPGILVELSVDLPDPCGKTPLTLGGATATTDGSGLAEFPSLSLNQSCLGYTLKATDTSGVLTFGVSSAFSIFDDIGTCAANQNCTASFSGTTSGSITAFATSLPGYTQIAASAEDLINCFGYEEASGTMLTFSSSDDRPNEVTILIDRSTLDPKRGAGTFRVCYSSHTLTSWTDRSGNTIGPDVASLLPDCTKTNPVAPCQLPTKMSKTLVTVKFLSPPGGSRGRS
jgi:hypothetical protein